MEIPRIWDVYPSLAMEVRDMHKRVGLTASGHDADHDFEVGQLALRVSWSIDQQAAILAGVAGLLHTSDRVLEASLGLGKETISVVPSESVRSFVLERLGRHTNINDEASIDRVVEAVVHHGSKPNESGDDLTLVALADADRLANMGASLPIRSGQHNAHLRLLNPITIQDDLSTRTTREKYNNPDSVLWDIQNAINWYRNPDGPYALRLPLSLEIGRTKAEFLEVYIQKIIEERAFVGLYPYPDLLQD
jgi:hypothetical protein